MNDQLYEYLVEKAAAPTAQPVMDDEGVTSQIEEAGSTEKGHVKNTHVPSVITTKNLFTHPDVHPIILGLVLLKRYGSDWLSWETETLQLRIPLDFKSAGLSYLNLSKIQAIKALHMVDSYWKRWEVFLACTMPFNNVLPDFDVMQVPTLAQCLVSVDTANSVRDDVVWSEEMKAYLSTIYLHDGILCTLPPIDFIQLHGEEYGVDCVKIEERWPKFMKENKTVEEHHPEDSQLNRMLDAVRYLRQHRDTLRDQLKVVDHV